MKFSAVVLALALTAASAKLDHPNDRLLRMGKSNGSSKGGKSSDTCRFPVTVGKSDLVIDLFDKAFNGGDGCTTDIRGSDSCQADLGGYTLHTYFQSGNDPSACCPPCALDMMEITTSCIATNTPPRNCFALTGSPGVAVVINGANAQGGVNQLYCCS